MITGSALWYLSRATGVVSIVLFTVSLALGMITAGRRRPTGQSATVVMAVHRWLSLGLLVFLATHIVTAIVDGYVSIGWLAVVVPFISGYQPIFVGLGTLAVDLLIVVLITSFLRHRMPERSWRFIHWSTYAMWLVAVVHGFLMGTSDQPGLRLTTLICAAIGGGLIIWRSAVTVADKERRAAINAQEWS